MAVICPSTNPVHDAPCPQSRHHAEMDTEFAELFRLLNNIIRYGTITGIDYAGTAVRVKTGDNETDWLQWGVRRAGNVREWDPPAVGEQVIILSPGGNLSAGTVYPAIYSETSPAPASSPTLYRRVFPDGAVLEYDFGSHSLLASLPGGSIANMTADEVIANTPITRCTGDLLVTGKAVIGQTLAVLGTDGTGASTSLAGKLTVSDDVIASGISLTGHRHQVTGIGTLTEEPE